MASPDLIVRYGDTRDWSFTLSDSAGTALSLVNARVYFKMRRHEWHTSDLFSRDSGGTGSDYITIAAGVGGTLTITPTASDWAGLSDADGVFVGEFKVKDSNSDLMFTQDIIIRVDGSLFV